MGSALAKVGSPIRSWCTRCREMRDHTVTTLEEKQPRRVTCDTCQGTHLYRPQPPRSRATAGRNAALQTTGWDDLMAVADLDHVRNYTMRLEYTAGDVINHKVFGLGVVVREVDPLKIQVSFQDGVKLLACNRDR